MNSVLGSATKAPAAFAWLSVAVACLMAVLLTGRLARLVARFIPATETYTTKSEDLIGMSGETVLTTTREFGTAQVWSKSGDMFQITCRSTEEDSLPPGTKVLVVGHDTATDVYHVMALPE